MLAGAGAALAAAVTGCAALPGDDAPQNQTYERLQRTAVYVADGVDLSVPEEVQTVNAAGNADLLVLPGDTGVDAETAVDWLAAGRVVSLLGGAAEATWLSWARSETYRDAFGEGGFGDSEPDPELLVATARETDVTTYRRSWSDEPRNRDVLRALDETLVDIETGTPE